MNNIVTASVEFYFKGEQFTPSITLQLDDYMQSGAGMPDLYPLIAAGNNIDLYSYEYEIMQSEPVKINAAQGLVANYIVNGVLDVAEFELAWHEQQARTAIRQIVEQHGLSHILQQHPALEDALLDIFMAGQENNTFKS